MARHLALLLSVLLLSGPVSHLVAAETPKTLDDFNALPAIKARGIQVTEFQAAPGLYLLNGVRKNRRGKTVPASLAVSEDLKYCFFGKILDSQSSKPLSIRKPMAAYENRASFSAGSGPDAYYIFTDPLCPWCAKLENELEKQGLTDTARLKYYVYPLHAGDEVLAKARFILSRSDDATRVAAMRSLMLRHDASYDDEPLSEAQIEAADTQVEQVRAIALDLAVRGTPTIFDAEGIRYTYPEFLRKLRRD